MEQAPAPPPASQPGPPPEQQRQRPPLSSLPAALSLSSTAPSIIPSSQNPFLNPNDIFNSKIPTPLLQQQTSQQSQEPKQQQPQSNFQTSQIRTPFNRPWSQPVHFSQHTNYSSSISVPAPVAPSSASTPPPKGVITLGLPAKSPTSTPTRPAKMTASFSPSSFAPQYAGVARAPVKVPESTARPAVRGMQNTGIMARQFRSGVVAMHHQARPQNSSNSQATAAHNFQENGLVRTSSSLRSRTISQSLQQRSNIVQQSHQAMPAAAQQHHPSSSQKHSQPQHLSSSQRQQQPLPSSNQPQEYSHQLPSPRIFQPPNQLVNSVQTLGNQNFFSPASADPNALLSNTNGRTTVVEADESGNRILSKRSIQELVKLIDPSEKLDHEVENILVDIAEEFIDSITTSGCSLAKHRKSDTLEAKDILLHLERKWNMALPTFSGDEVKTYKETAMNDARKERLAVIRKSGRTYDAMSNKSSARHVAGNAKGHLAKTALT